MPPGPMTTVDVTIAGIELCFGVPDDLTGPWLEGFGVPDGLTSDDLIGVPPGPTTTVEVTTGLKLDLAGVDTGAPGLLDFSGAGRGVEDLPGADEGLGVP